MSTSLLSSPEICDQHVGLTSPKVCDQDAKDRHEKKYKIKYEICNRVVKKKKKGSISSPGVCHEYEICYRCNRVAKKKKGSISSPGVCHEYEICYRNGKKNEVCDGRKNEVCDRNSKIYEVCNGVTKKKGSKLPWMPHEVCNRVTKKKGSKLPWMPHEDEMLRSLVKKYGAKHWSNICKEIPGRSAKSSRLRWFNYLLPGLNLNPFTPEEDSIIVDLHRTYGTRWAMIAREISGRSDNAIKNRWNCSLKNRQGYKPPKRSNNVSSPDEHFGSKDRRINVAESSKSLPKTLYCENIDADTCKRDGESRCENIEAAGETYKRDIELWKPPQELNLLSPGTGISHREKHEIFGTQQDFTGIKIDHGIDDPITTLTLCFPDYEKLVRSNRN